MLDPKLIRNELGVVAKRLKVKNFELNVEQLKEWEGARKDLQLDTEKLQNERNSKSKLIGEAKSQGKDVSAILTDMEDLKSSLDKKKNELGEIQSKLHEYLLNVPNIPDEEVPPGKDESDNQVINTWGSLPKYNFDVKDHSELGEKLEQGLDFAAAVTLSGSRFVVLEGRLAKLHRALSQFMLDVHTEEHGYLEFNLPLIVNHESLLGTGQLPKFEDDLFKVNHEGNFYLIPTAEVPLTNLVRGKILEADALPLKYTAHTPCFRSEAGSYGKDTKGMIRQHQFEKVELVQVVKPESSDDALNELTGHAESILRKLGLPYRKVLLCGGDLGFGASKTYDLEVWLPSQNTYREISSCSSFTDFQARRMQARWRSPTMQKPQFVHTINGSGIAIGRALVAVMENYQDETGRIQIPSILRPYMGNAEFLE
jgi:seryl-tRNA synthetase|tara:strand:+ start:998 stop:2275 length:1278 start_codon:yes stop_codon:yes gene_type:complete